MTARTTSSNGSAPSSTDESEPTEAESTATETDDGTEAESTATEGATDEATESSDDAIDEDAREETAPIADEEARTEDATDEDATDEDAADVAPVATPPSPPPAPAPAPTADGRTGPSDEWTTGQLASVLTRALAVVVVLALIGFGLGAMRGPTNVATAEFVYTLDQSVPDSFLREDRRLLTQVATFTSDAVLRPVARQFDVDVEDLRGSIDIETVALSEVLRLQVTDPDAGRALAMNRAVLDQYLLVVNQPAPAGDNRQLTTRRDEIVADLAVADEQRRAIDQRASELDVRQQSVQRRIDLTRDRIGQLQGQLDDTIIGAVPRVLAPELATELADVEDELIALETELALIVDERAGLTLPPADGSADGSVAPTALDREIERLESELATVDEELSQRQLGPLVASPIRELSEPVVVERSATAAGLQGAALAALAALPIAAWVAYRTRRRQLWLA